MAKAYYVSANAKKMPMVMGNPLPFAYSKLDEQCLSLSFETILEF